MENEQDFDAMLDSGYRAEFDRRMQEAVRNAGANLTDERIVKLEKQLNSAVRREQTLAAGVDGRFARFVAAEVAENMRDGDDFSEALRGYLANNTQYLAAPAPQTVGWGYAQQGGGEPTGGVEAAFYALNPRLRRGR